MTRTVLSAAPAAALATVLVTVLAVTLAVTFASTPIEAHHSYAGFDQERTIFEGRVESLTIENPHTLIKMQGTDGQRYLIVFLAASALGRTFANGAEGLTARIHIGDTLTVSGRLKRGADIIEVAAAQIDDAKGVPIHPLNRPPISRTQATARQ